MINTQYVNRYILEQLPGEIIPLGQFDYYTSQEREGGSHGNREGGTELEAHPKSRIANLGARCRIDK